MLRFDSTLQLDLQGIIPFDIIAFIGIIFQDLESVLLVQNIVQVNFVHMYALHQL